MTESIQNTSPRIHSFADSEPRNKKPVSEKLAPRIYPWGQCFNLKSQISNLKSIDFILLSGRTNKSPSDLKYSIISVCF